MGPTEHRAGGPQTVAMADWGSAGPRRQVATARRLPGGSWDVAPPVRVGPAGAAPLQRLGIGANDVAAGALMGLDFPIGLPAAYAEAAGIERFLEVLPRLGGGEWSEFFDVASDPDQISLRRPFYPARTPRPGTARWDHLVAGLGVPKAALRRRCEALDGEALFWTVGPRQVGKAAIDAWRSLLQPLLSDPGAARWVRVWPFDGPFDSLLRPGHVVLAEAYPSGLRRRLALRAPPSRRWSKARVDDRAALGAALAEWASSAQPSIVLRPELIGELRAGFGAGPGAEDRFDAVTGLLGLLDLLAAGRLPVPPANPAVATIEGWALGVRARKDEPAAAQAKRNDSTEGGGPDSVTAKRV